MAVSEQTDSLRVLGSDPVDYLITPRVFACMVANPILNLLCFAMGKPHNGGWLAALSYLYRHISLECESHLH